MSKEKIENLLSKESITNLHEEIEIPNSKTDSIPYIPRLSIKKVAKAYKDKNDSMLQRKNYDLALSLNKTKPS